MVITACAHPQTDDARGLVLARQEPTIARYLEEGGRGIMTWVVFVAGMLAGLEVLAIIATIGGSGK